MIKLALRFVVGCSIHWDYLLVFFISGKDFVVNFEKNCDLTVQDAIKKKARSKMASNCSAISLIAVAGLKNRYIVQLSLIHI